MKNIAISRFRNYKEKFPDMNINLWDWLTIPNDYTLIVDQIRKSDDKQIIRKLKEELPAITPSGTFFKREANGLLKHSGLICIDIDGKDNPHFQDMEVLKKHISQYENILYCGLSVSGKGLFCLIPIAYPEKHYEHFLALEREFSEWMVAIDKSCSDVCRLRGYSFDYNPYINLAALTFHDTIERSLSSKIGKSNSENNSTLHPKLSVNKEPYEFVQSNIDFFNSLTELIIEFSVLKSKSELVRKLIDQVIDKQVDITVDRADWVQICCTLSNIFKEDGRNLFHQVSQFYPNYQFEENDRLYSDILEKGYRGNSDNLFKIAAKYGIG